MRALGALKRVRTDQPLKPWLLQITLNLCRTLHKRKQPLTFSELEGEESEPLELTDEAPLPPDWAELQETRELVRRAMAELSPAYRAALTLRYNEDLTYEDIARILELPLNTVRTHLFRAKEQLRLRLADWFKENDYGLPNSRPTHRKLPRKRTDADEAD